MGTDAFLSLAQAQRTTHGYPHLPVVLVPHPIGGVDPGSVRAKAEKVADQVLAALTSDPAPPPATVAASSAAVADAPDDLDRFQEWACEEGWSDGLPVLPPTRERVARILGARDAGHVVTTLAPLNGRATLEMIAVNAAMTGAGPEHMPVIVAALRGLAEPRFNLNAIQTTTHPCTPLLIVNGPIVRRLGINAGPNALGQGHRANAVIGRAVRLVLQNVGGARPGREDRATLGHPGKFSYCLAENEAVSPWEPLHVERGFGREESTVTVCGSEAPHNVNDHGSTTAEGLLQALAGSLATPASNNAYLAGEPLVILGPEHAQTIATSGWSKADLKRALWEKARVPVRAFSGENLARFVVIDRPRFTGLSADAALPPFERPEDLMVIVAGGPGKHSMVVPTFGSTRSVTVRVEEGS